MTEPHFCLRATCNDSRLHFWDNSNILTVTQENFYGSLSVILMCGVTAAGFFTPSSKEPLVYQFRCFISECNKKFVTRPICNANVCTVVHQVDVTSELSHSKSNHSFALFGIVDTHTTLQK